MRRAAATLESEGSGPGRLDTALKRLDRALDKHSRADDRLPVLERLVARLQALRLIAHSSAEQPMDVDEGADEAEGAADEVTNLLRCSCHVHRILMPATAAIKVLPEIAEYR